MADVDPGRIGRYLAETRAGLDRVQPTRLAAALADGALLVDLRPAVDRAADGTHPAAVVVERIHLEWRLDPTSPHRLAEATPGRRVILMCNDGYASSLAAAELQRLGVDDATDLVGGYRAWAARPH